jgi:NhaA family Na+:H+ antiporter
MATKLSQVFNAFFESEKAGGLVLLACTLFSLLLANAGIGPAYQAFFHSHIGGLSLEHWINDGLMAIFFLLIGLELEREVYIGELANIKDALLPIFAALGGILVPAGIYTAFNLGTDTQSGVGIPMATDIAFALGILSLLGKRVPASLKVFLAALAIADDLGAILIIALFYTKTLHLSYLLMAMGTFGILLVLNRLKVHILWPYLLGGVLMWALMLQSGVHATITGVLLAFAIPFGKGDHTSPSYHLQHFLHKPVAFGILPIFALANTAIVFSSGWTSALTEASSLGIALGLIVGKPAGILLFAFLAVQMKLCKLPSDLNWKAILGVGQLGGIGFTMSIFITLLAFEDPALVNTAKMVILLASCAAGLLGFLFLKRFLPS